MRETNTAPFSRLYSLGSMGPMAPQGGYILTAQSHKYIITHCHPRCQRLTHNDLRFLLTCDGNNVTLTDLHCACNMSMVCDNCW